MFEVGSNSFFEPKSEKIVKAYVNKLKKSLFREDKHPWMRSEPFDDENYQCDFDGRKVSLRAIFWGSESKRKANIIIISGEKHIGKSFFAEQILKECANSLEEEKGSLFFNNRRKSYRIPVLIRMKEFERQNYDEIDLKTLIFQTICNDADYIDERRQKSLQVDIGRLLSQGRFVIYFESNDWIQKGDMLSRLLNYGTVYSGYKTNAKYHNLVLMTADVDGKIKDSFLNEKNCGYVTLKPLRIEEVKMYLNSHKLINLLEIAENNEDIMELMRYPEHLRMFEVLCVGEMLESKDEIKDKIDLYEFFIRAHIGKVLRDKSVYVPKREEVIFSSLKKYAWEKYVVGREPTFNSSRYFNLTDGRECGLLDTGNDFVFQYCGYYLAACELLEKIERGNINFSFSDTAKIDRMENIFILVSQLIKNVETFSKYWNALADASQYPLLLLAKIVKKSKFRQGFQEKLYEKAFDNLKSDFYDYSVLETFEELKSGCAEYLKEKYFLLDGYDEESQNNIKKRIVYYLGISHNGILQGMIDELLCDETDRHLQYHIIRAAVENYGKDEETTKLIQTNIDRMSAYCHRHSDPIIKSDFSILFENCQKQPWQVETQKLDTIDQLKEKLEDEVYWVRAHAAGAIGRRKENETCQLLLVRIKKELNCIYNLEEDYRNSIKVISYSVEALCELHMELEDNEKEMLVKELVQIIDVSIMKRNEDIDDAYSTIATGIEYMINTNKDKLAFNLGGRFRNRTTNYRKIVLYIMEELQNYFEDDAEMVNLIRNKCSELKGIHHNEVTTDKRKKRVLHLSDWHWIEESTDNTLIMYKIKGYGPIDLLLITGDLRQFGADYSKSLETLNEIKDALGLELKDIFMVPGNHDADTISDQENIYRDIREQIYSNNDYYKNYEDSLYTAFATYGNFVKEFFGEEYYDHGGIHSNIFLWEECVYILCMNTSLVCDKSSVEKKFVNTGELAEIVGRVGLKDEYPVIGISHHPFEELHDTQRQTVQSILTDLRLSVLLSGDKHISRSNTIGSKQAGIPNLIIGKTYVSAGDNYSEQNIAIYDLNFETKKMTPYLKKWEQSRFVPAHEFSHEISENNWETENIDLLYDCQSMEKGMV